MQNAPSIASYESGPYQLGKSNSWSKYNTAGDWGIGLTLTYDVATGYTAEVLSFDEGDLTYLATNPAVYAKAYT